MNVKKVLSILLTLLIILSMAGCGEEPVEEVDNVSNGVEFFESLSKTSEFESYTFAATISWTIPDFTEDVKSTFDSGDTYSSDSQSDTMVDSATNLVKQALRKKFYVEGTVVKTSNGSDIAFTLYKNSEKSEKIIDMVIKGKDVYVNVKSLVNDFLESEVIKKDYLLINVDGINSLGEAVNDIMADIMRQSAATKTDASPIMPDYADTEEPADASEGEDPTVSEPVDATPTPNELNNSSLPEDGSAETEAPDAISASDDSTDSSAENEPAFEDNEAEDDDFNYGYNPVDDSSATDDDMSSGGMSLNFELPKVNLDCLKTLVAPLASGIQKTFSSAEFNVFSVDAQGYNVMEINQSDVLAIVKNILLKYREDSQNLYTALQECITQSGISDMLPSFTQQDIEKGLDDAVLTVQDAIDFDETDGISFLFNVKSKYSGDTFSGGFEFSFQQDATQLSFSVMTDRTKDSSASVNAPSDYCTLTDFVSAVLPEAIAGLSSGDIMIEDPGDGEDHLSIFS